MRNLNGHDVFMALKVLQKIGVKDELVALATYINEQYNGTGQQTTKNAQEIGARLIFGVLANCGDEAAEKAFFSFLAGPLETTPEELEERDALGTCEEVARYIETIDRERWRAFFISLSAAIKTTN